ncbi:MAG: ABC transporter ATP-binding protein, partial [Acidimicrobiales bacterium]
VVKAFGQEAREIDRLAVAARRLFASRVRTVKIQARYMPTLAAIPSLVQVAVLALGGWLALHHRISLGTFLAFSAYALQLVAPVRMFAGMLAVGQQARAGAERILDILDSNPLVTESPDAIALPKVRGDVELDDVRFGYVRGEPVLEGFSLRVGAGERVALVGASGSGKSTISLLLPRFYDVTAGAIRIDGVDVRAVTFDSLRSQVGVVFEESFLFSDSVRANIAYGRPDASDREVEAAARAAEAHEFIEAMPDGYATVVGERGLTLSGGQRQRISLARALLSDPAILVLDDATSSIDAATEEDIHDTLRRIMDGRTTILVAHRRSTLRLADRIVVVDGGRVVDTGSHEELSARSALYRDLLGGEEAERPPVDVPAVVVPSVEVPSRPGGPGMMLEATPALLAAVEALPPADDVPDVDPALLRADGRTFSLRGFVRPFRWALGLGLSLVIADTLLGLGGPYLVSRGLDRGVGRGSEQALWVISGVFLATVLLDWAVTWTYTRYTGRTAERLLFALRVRIFAHLQRLSVDYYDREMAGRIMTRMTTDVEAFSQLLQTGLITAIVSIFTCSGVAVALGILDWRLALAAAVVLAPLVAATIAFRNASNRIYRVARERIAAVNANFQESLSGVRVAQAHRREEGNVAAFQVVAARHRAARVNAQQLIALYFPFIVLLSDLAEAAVLGRGSALTLHHQVSAGVVIGFLLYLDQFFSPIQQLSQLFDTYQEAAASGERINELMATETGTPESPTPVTGERPLRGDIVFRDVHFSYPAVDAEALAGVDIHITPGETVALVGETGAGKSTIVKLIARFYDPTAGAVLVDGIPVGEFDLGWYRRQLGVVPQEAFLFSGTIRDNIAYGDPSATDAAVEAAARAVGAHDLVTTLPGGYAHVVSERGRSLSAGQRQLIALARAQLVDPAILLLDEATSNLDLASEARVQQAMGVLSQGRTTVLVAHRLPTARRADRILVIERGKVVEEGTHDELVARDGVYAALWDAFATTGSRDRTGLGRSA